MVPPRASPMVSLHAFPLLPGREGEALSLGQTPGSSRGAGKKAGSANSSSVNFCTESGPLSGKAARKVDHFRTTGCAESGAGPVRRPHASLARQESNLSGRKSSSKQSDSQSRPPFAPYTDLPARRHPFAPRRQPSLQTSADSAPPASAVRRPPPQPPPPRCTARHLSSPSPRPLPPSPRRLFRRSALVRPLRHGAARARRRRASRCSIQSSSPRAWCGARPHHGPLLLLAPRRAPPQHTASRRVRHGSETALSLARAPGGVVLALIAWPALAGGHPGDVRSLLLQRVHDAQILPEQRGSPRRPARRALAPPRATSCRAAVAVRRG